MHHATVTLLAILTAAAIWLGGCNPGQISGGEAKLQAEGGSAGLLDRLSSAENVSENDAFHSLLMLLEGKDEHETFARRVAALRERKLLDETWDFQADRPITRGKVAYMVYQACHVPGGLILTLTGPSQRYCLRELQYREMMTDGAVYTPVSGMEFVAVLTRADHYLQTGDIPDTLRTAGG